VELLLVRHASHGDADRVLTGRIEGRGLTEAGRAEAARLARALAGCGIGRVLSSPRARARETAAMVAAALGNVAVETADEIDEIDFGRWAGQSFAALEDDPDWRRWNAARGLWQTPAGDTMLAVQNRARTLIRRLRAEGTPSDRIVLVTHADVIRAIVCDQIGLAIDLGARLDVSRASVTTLFTDGEFAMLTGLNCKGGMRWD
jgi:broad specificity phosphatase PhoE